jgi:hypothetical protein
LERLKREGDRVVVHGLRGRASNRKIATKVQTQALEILKQPDWHDFGPTFASEQVAKRHGIELSDETLRRWMITAGLWKSRTRKMEDVHCWRPHRSGFGELVQWDTSEHDWLEGRGPVRYLVRLMDDANERFARPLACGECAAIQPIPTIRPFFSRYSHSTPMLKGPREREKRSERAALRDVHVAAESNRRRPSHSD